MQIFISGSLAFDRIMSFPGKFSDHILPEKIHILNVCFMVDGLEERFGGTAGNIAYNLALLDEKPTIVAAAGKDFGEYKTRLEGMGLPMEGVRIVDDVVSAGAYITTDKADNQITGFNPGAMNFEAAFDFSGVDPKNSMAIISPGCIADMNNLPVTFKKLGIPYIFDPGQSLPAFSGDQLKACIEGSAMLITNDYELQLIMNATGLSEDALCDLTGVAVTTLGEKGAVIRENGEARRIDALKVDDVADPTGAGDAFRAGLLKGLTMGKSLDAAARMGSVCAAYCVEKLGTQEHSFTMDEYTKRHEDAFGPLT